MDIAYDAIGNPIHDGVWTYTWENGRQLRRMACDATIAEFVYNADGLRVQKTVNGVTTNYTLHGKNIVHIRIGRRMQQIMMLRLQMHLSMPFGMR